MILDSLIVGLVVSAAAVWLGRHFLKSWRGESRDPGCASCPLGKAGGRPAA